MKQKTLTYTDGVLVDTEEVEVPDAPPPPPTADEIRAKLEDATSLAKMRDVVSDVLDRLDA